VKVLLAGSLYLVALAGSRFLSYIHHVSSRIGPIRYLKSACMYVAKDNLRAASSVRILYSIFLESGGCSQRGPMGQESSQNCSGCNYADKQFRTCIRDQSLFTWSLVDFSKYLVKTWKVHINHRYFGGGSSGLVKKSQLSYNSKPFSQPDLYRKVELIFITG
jgi:hypothetical protein